MMRLYYIIPCTCLLLFFLCRQEIKRTNRLRLGWRLLASGIAIASLVCMAMPVSTKKSGSTFKEVVLLTSGFRTDSVTRFLQQAGKNIEVYSTAKKSPAAFNNQPVKRIADAGMLKEEIHPSLLHIFGDGLYENDLQLLDQTPVSFHPAQKNPAISSVSWTQKIRSGDVFSIQGNFDNSSHAPLKLFLKGLNTVVDSVSIAANTLQDFKLGTIPKQVGSAVYSLLAVSGKDTLEKEPVPFIVEPPEPLSILMLASSPGFENKFLKNWLSQQGYAVTVRTGISKNKYDRQFLNTPKATAERLTASYLASFDLLITNTTELALMSIPEIEIIRTAVEQKGMGLVIAIDSGRNKSAFYLKSFALFTPKPGQLQNFTITPENNTDNRFTLHIENPVCIRYQTGTQVLLQDEQANIFASSSRYGLGKIVVTGITETYVLALSGNNNSYTSLWTLLLQKAAKKTDPAESWSVSPAFPFPGEPALLHLETNNTGLPQVQAGERHIAPQQNPLLPFQWQGNYWPTDAGWQSTIAALSQPAYWWYTYQPGDWQQVLAIQKTKATRQYASAHPYTSTAPPQNAAGVMQSLYIYFFLAFLCCCGFLWIEQKM